MTRLGCEQAPLSSSSSSTTSYIAAMLSQGEGRSSLAKTNECLDGMSVSLCMHVCVHVLVCMCSILFRQVAKASFCSFNQRDS